MVRAAKVITPQVRESVERAIAAAEARTSAEIVVVVATRSGRYERAEDAFGLVAGLASVLIAGLLIQPPPESGSWRTTLAVPLGLPATLLLFAAACIGGAMLAMHVPALARPFRTRAEVLDHVQRRGLDCFNNFRLRATRSGTGVLLYVSLMERTAWVVADDAVARRLAPSAWEPVCRELVAGFRAGTPKDGLCAGIGKAAEILAGILPPNGPPKNEVPDTVRVID